VLTAGLISLPSINFGQDSTSIEEKNIYIIGPQEGYSPQIGTLLSTMTMMQKWVVDTVQDLSVEELDFSN